MICEKCFILQLISDFRCCTIGFICDGWRKKAILIKLLSFKNSMLPDRLVDTKVANLLLKVAQKVATFKKRFKTSLKQILNRLLKVTFLDYILELVLNLY